MRDLGYYNGEILPLSQLKIPALDRAVYFGDGVYDVAFVHRRVPFALKDHMDRFFSSCQMLGIDFLMPRRVLAETMFELIDQLDSPECVLYFQASRATAPRSHAVARDLPCNLLMMLTPTFAPLMGQTATLITREDTRFLHCNIKTLNLIPNVLAAIATEEASSDECVFHRDGTVTECAHSSLLILQGNTLRTHPLNEYILPGTTRKHVLDMAPTIGLSVQEKAFSLEEMFDADEVLLTSSISLIRQVTAIDGRPVGGRANLPLERLMELYATRFESETRSRTGLLNRL